MKTYAIILASGSGERFASTTPKQFLKISGKTLLEHATDAFEHHPLIDDIIVVTRPDDLEKTIELLRQNNHKKVHAIIAGGKTRQESAYNGIKSIPDDDAYVLIHDAVRPLIDQATITRCIEALLHNDAVDVAIPASDTIVKANDQMIITDIPERRHYFRGQTPQGFSLKIIKKAHKMACSRPDITFTDDCGIVHYFNLAPIYVVTGDTANIKVTYPIDIDIADKLFQTRQTKQQTCDFSLLHDKTIIVIGGTRGIGKAIVEQARIYGMAAYSVSRTTGVDVTQPQTLIDAFKNIHQQTGHIHYIINCAGILDNCIFIQQSDTIISDMIMTNYIGTINVAKCGYPFLKSSNGCLLLFASSSYTHGRAKLAIYSSTKSAVVNFAQAISDEWAQDNIRVNVIVPQRTATDMRTNAFGLEPQNTLLSPDTVAQHTLQTLLQDFTGQVIDIRINQS